MRVRRGQVITPRRQRMIHAYTKGHMWVRQAFYEGTLSGVEYLKFKQWEKEFLNHDRDRYYQQRADSRFKSVWDDPAGGGQVG